MPNALLPLNEGLLAGSRFRRRSAGAGLAVADPQAGELRAAELLLLFAAGGLAAVGTLLLDTGLRVPGHAILRTVLPLALGLALVPRWGSGLVMSGSAALVAFGLQISGAGEAGFGATTSMLLTGPLLDLAARWSSRGWQLYLAFAAAGLTSNGAAFVVRWLSKVGSGGGGGGGLGGGRALGEWWSPAIVGYAVCGLLAGLLSAAICFRASSGPATERSDAT